MDKQTNIRAVIFDMDGVLVDSEKLINTAAITMFKEKGLIVHPDDFLPFVGAGEDRYVGGVADRYGFPLDGPAAKQRTYEIYLELAPSQLEVFSGTLDLLHACRRAGLLIAVASSADEIKVRANLQTIGLPLDFWNTVVKGEDALRKKPAPDGFLFAAEKLGVMPAECVVVEDAVNGIQAAKAAGMRCVAVATSFPPARLYEADVVRDSIAQVSLSDLAPHLGKS
jgi:HAD superfamily hydrolase (TIGR01509 family)